MSDNFLKFYLLFGLAFIFIRGLFYTIFVEPLTDFIIPNAIFYPIIKSIG